MTTDDDDRRTRTVERLRGMTTGGHPVRGASLQLLSVLFGLLVAAGTLYLISQRPFDTAVAVALVLVAAGLVLLVGSWIAARRRGRLTSFWVALGADSALSELPVEERRRIGRQVLGRAEFTPGDLPIVTALLAYRSRSNSRMVASLLGLYSMFIATGLVISAPLAVFAVVGGAVAAGIIALDFRRTSRVQRDLASRPS